MALTAGTRLGPYEVLAPLGAGGMGEVYRARDTSLNRDVAIKVLHDAALGDADRRARFTREAQTLAALNHPNIAHIYGFETQANALVMELVEGEDLSELIARHGRSAPAAAGSSEPASRGPAARGGGAPRAMDIEDALPIARQIVDALEAAHEQGIVHRDLKPANVKVRADGTVKVLDFGLAKALGPPSPEATAGKPDYAMNSPTLTARATQLGMILGTAAYMAPEQARGKAVDRRADIWAFGVVLYEMLAGRRAFEGDDVSTTMAAVLMKDPDWSALPASTPRALQQLIRRCLERDPKLRLRDIGEARIILSDPSALRDQPASADSPAAAAAATPQGGIRAGVVVAATALALALGVVSGITWQRWRTVPPSEWTASRLGGPATAFYPEVSPDGHLVAFQTLADGQSQIAVMKPGTGNWTVVTNDRTRGFINTLAWARDGSHIYYDRVTDVANGIYSVPGLGGAERLVIENAGSPAPLADGSLLFLRANADRLIQAHRFWPDKGTIEALPFVKASAGYMFARQLDAGRVAIFGRPIAEKQARDDLYVMTLADGDTRKLELGSALSANSAMSVDPTDGSLAVTTFAGNTWRVIRIAPDNPAERKTLLTFVSVPYISFSPAGELILSLSDRPYELLRYAGNGVEVARLERGLTFSGPPLALADGRVLITSVVASRRRVVVISPGKEPLDLAQTDQETDWPMTLVGSDRIALTFGPDGAEIAIVSIATGAIVKRFPAPGRRNSLGASPDGKTLYTVVRGSVEAMSADTGVARTIGKGDSFSVDPDTGDLIVKLDEVDRFRLVRMRPDTGATTPIEIRSAGLRLVDQPLGAGMIRNGRMALPAGTVDSWNWLSATLTLSTGALERVPIKYDSDIHFTAWAPDGQIVASGLGMSASLWKFASR